MIETKHSWSVTHLLRIGAYVGAFFWLAFVWGALKAISMPESRRYSHFVAWVILIAAVVAMVVTVEHWVKYLGIMLAGGILGGLLATMSGHLLNDNRPFPRPIALSITALFVGCALVSRNIALHHLGVLDRIALVGFIAACMSGFVIGTPQSVLIGVGGGFGCLLAAWTRDRLSHPTRR